jgi:hypothetical protein
VFHWVFMVPLENNTSNMCYCIPCRKVRSCSRLNKRQEECEQERESDQCDCICAKKCSDCDDWSCKQHCIPDHGCPNLDALAGTNKEKKPTKADNYVPKESKSNTDSGAD